MALICDEQNKKEDALKYYGQALMLNGKHIGALMKKSIIKEDVQNQVSEALKSYNAILNIDLKHTLSIYRKAVVY